MQCLACWAHNPKVRKEQSFMSACRIVLQSRTWTCPFPESGADSATHLGQIVDFPVPQVVEEIVEEISLRIGGWCWAPKSSPSRLKNFLVRRARVRDDPGRSPQIELEPERSFDGPLSGQSVYEQTSGVFRHTESVRDDKVHEQDWRHALEQKSRAPPARPSDDITAQSHSVPGGQSVSDFHVRTLRTVADARSNDAATPRASSKS